MRPLLMAHFLAVQVARTAASNVSAIFERRIPVNIPLKQAIVTGGVDRIALRIS